MPHVLVRTALVKEAMATHHLPKLKMKGLKKIVRRTLKKNGKVPAEDVAKLHTSRLSKGGKKWLKKRTGPKGSKGSKGNQEKLFAAGMIQNIRFPREATHHTATRTAVQALPENTPQSTADRILAASKLRTPTYRNRKGALSKSERRRNR